jgi:hypothetical protein
MNGDHVSVPSGTNGTLVGPLEIGILLVEPGAAPLPGGAWTVSERASGEGWTARAGVGVHGASDLERASAGRPAR